MGASIPQEDWADFERITKYLREHIDFSKNPIPLVPARHIHPSERPGYKDESDTNRADKESD